MFIQNKIYVDQTVDSESQGTILELRIERDDTDHEITAVDWFANSNEAVSVAYVARDEINKKLQEEGKKTKVRSSQTTEAGGLTRLYVNVRDGETEWFWWDVRKVSADRGGLEGRSWHFKLIVFLHVLRVLHPKFRLTGDERPLYLLCPSDTSDSCPHDYGGRYCTHSLLYARFPCHVLQSLLVLRPAQRMRFCITMALSAKVQAQRKHTGYTHNTYSSKLTTSDSENIK